MDIADLHMESKNVGYWSDLTGGVTGQYKSRVMEELIRAHLPAPRRSLIDIGCGTCEEILKYKTLLRAEKLTCTDYDAGIVESMKAKHTSEPIEWRVADIFALDKLNENYDLVFLMDVIHEVYSFYGRPDRDMNQPIDHELGLGFVKTALDQVAHITTRGGGVIITDDVLSDFDTQVVVRIKTAAAQEAVKYFCEHYPSRKFDYKMVKGDTMTLRSRDLNILLTQYNKIKAKNWPRWEIERAEIHEYMSPSEYREAFSALGFKTHIIVGTPESAWAEWNEDFEMLTGLPQLPEKRITLLAIKHAD